MTAATDTMPALPEPAMEDVPYELWGQNAIHPALYTADQLNDYGRQCAEQERERCAKAVEVTPAYRWVDGSDQWGRPCPAKVITTRSDYASAIRSLKDTQ